MQWKRISCKQNARWQQLSQLKASAFFCLKKRLVVKKFNNFYMGLVTPFSGALLGFNLSNGVTDTLESNSILIYLIQVKGIYTQSFGGKPD
jgi:hypothetical protein